MLPVGGVVVALVFGAILALAGVIVVIWLIHGKGKKKYSCKDGKCVEDSKGVYSSSDCNGVCGSKPPPSKYKFNCDSGSGKCVQEAGGTYDDKEECEAVCHKKPLPGGKIFLTAENRGFVADQGLRGQLALIPGMERGRFSSIVIIWLASSHVSLLDTIDQAKNGVMKNILGDDKDFPVEYWLQYDVDQHDSTTTSSCGSNLSCAQPMQQILDDANKALASKSLGKISGLHFDQEAVGDNLDGIVKSMEKVANDHNLELSFTKGIKRCTQRSPNGGTKDWNYCLGQTYTDNTANIYKPTGCGEASLDVMMGPDYWGRPGIITGGYSTPLLCAGGNCQGDADMMTKADPDPSVMDCWDERLTTAGMNDIISRIDQHKFPNIGFWYGTDAKSGKGRCN